MKGKNWALLLFDIILLFFIIMFKNIGNSYIFWIIMTIVLLLKYRFPKDKNYLKSGAIRIIIISILSYLLITYALGIIVGFSKNIFKLDFISILINISTPLIILVCQEVIRYIYAKNTFSDKKAYILLTFIFIFLDIIMEYRGYSFYNAENVFRFICLVVCVSIARESLYSYITYKVGFAPTLILKMFLNISIFILPIFPDLGDYITSVVGVLYPVVIYFFIYNLIKKYNKDNKYVAKVGRKYLFYPVVIILCAIVFLVSGIGKYKMIAVGSGSMEPTFYRGDAVIYKKITSIKEIEVGMVIAYQKDNKLITHRVIYITGNKINTKGDNNDNVDDYDIDFEEVVGIVGYKVSYIGYPTIWLNEKFGKI